MAAYGKEDFVYTGFEDYDFSDFSDFSDDENVQENSESVASGSEIEDEGLNHCVCGGPMTKEMIGCDGENCAVEWWHYECAGITKETVPDEDWFCPRCRPTTCPDVAGKMFKTCMN